ncbi:ABC transporter substrate-binding protein [Sphingomonas sp. Leaf17]|uniref:ABC transporter substrate-binding protein n=1 Tax=Sphingomonas sp. Leaf17 TaxID=1735683 RepID=UPI0007014E04|nr:ABC transporter substrate-binding protein [Sphingomonas sp. Leaf17]KQM63225.1 ABC transporter substrate-binding protein [Sphingomonas sp. Leaf17]
MKRILPLLLLAGCSQPFASRGGGGIVSTNPCADAMLVRMVSPDRIAAISHYSQEAGATSIPLAVARRYRATAGTAEEVIALKPDLVLASSFTQGATREAFAAAGLHTVYLDSPVTVAASKAQVTQVAEAVGAPARGRAINAAIDRAVADAPPAGRPAALLYIAGDLVNGGGTLLDALMTRAGFANAAATYGLAYTGTLPAELLVARPPDVVIAPPGTSRGAALRRAMLPGARFATFDRRLVNCGGPTIVPAMARLRAIRAGVS